MAVKQQIGSALAEEQIVRYLLDEMNTEERSSLEDRLAQDPAVFEAIAATEDDVIMRYLRGDLDARLLPRFEEVYLHSPAKRARVEQARMLQQAVRDAGCSQRGSLSARWFALPASRLRLALLSAGLGVVVIAAVLLPRLPDRTPAPLMPQNSSLLRVSLEPGLVRGSPGVQITPPPAIKQVQFKLTLPRQATDESYRAVLQTPERPELWKGLITRKEDVAILTIPANLLAAGDYMFLVQRTTAGQETVAAYYFRVK
jgi:hypothetical protein